MAWEFTLACQVWTLDALFFAGASLGFGRIDIDQTRRFCQTRSLDFFPLGMAQNSFADWMR